MNTNEVCLLYSLSRIHGAYLREYAFAHAEDCTNLQVFRWGRTDDEARLGAAPRGGTGGTATASDGRWGLENFSGIFVRLRSVGIGKCTI